LFGSKGSLFKPIINFKTPDPADPNRRHVHVNKGLQQSLADGLYFKFLEEVFTHSAQELGIAIFIVFNENVFDCMCLMDRALPVCETYRGFHIHELTQYACRSRIDAESVVLEALGKLKDRKDAFPKERCHLVVEASLAHGQSSSKFTFFLLGSSSPLSPTEDFKFKTRKQTSVQKGVSNF
jgi:hypothetical protein